MPVDTMQHQTPRTGPLAGIRIVDMTSVMLGPLATMLLADLGADVIKLESPRGSGGGSAPGDIWRYAGRAPAPGMGPMFAALNRNKRSVSMDLSQEADRELFDGLIAEADVFIHNVRMAGMRRLGADYEAIRKLKEDIIYVHCAGFGQDGPYGPLSAYDDLIQAASGFADLAAKRNGGEPGYTPSAVADKVTGLFAANAVLAALLHRGKTGEGQLIEVPMYECFTFFNLVEHLYGATWLKTPGTMGYSRSINPQRAPYATLDGYISIVPYSDAQWQKFLTLGGFPQVFNDPRFSTYAARTENTGELYAYIREAAQARTTAEWLTLLAAEDIPAMRCNAMEDLLEDPHLVETGFFSVLEHPAAGAYRSMRHPVSFAATPAAIYRHPPLFGEDTADVAATLAKRHNEESSA